MGNNQNGGCCGNNKVGSTSQEPIPLEPAPNAGLERTFEANTEEFDASLDALAHTQNTKQRVQKMKNMFGIDIRPCYECMNLPNKNKHCRECYGDGFYPNGGDVSRGRYANDLTLSNIKTIHKKIMNLKKLEEFAKWDETTERWQPKYFISYNSSTNQISYQDSREPDASIKSADYNVADFHYELVQFQYLDNKSDTGSISSTSSSGLVDLNEENVSPKQNILELEPKYNYKPVLAMQRREAAVEDEEKLYGIIEEEESSQLSGLSDLEETEESVPSTASRKGDGLSKLKEKMKYKVAEMAKIQKGQGTNKRLRIDALELEIREIENNIKCVEALEAGLDCTGNGTDEKDEEHSLSTQLPMNLLEDVPSLPETMRSSPLRRLCEIVAAY